MTMLNALWRRTLIGHGELLAAVRCTSAAGHEYGGQTVALLGQLLYSGSKDCSVR